MRHGIARREACSNIKCHRAHHLPAKLKRRGLETVDKYRYAVAVRPNARIKEPASKIGEINFLAAQLALIDGHGA